MPHDFAKSRLAFPVVSPTRVLRSWPLNCSLKNVTSQATPIFVVFLRYFLTHTHTYTHTNTHLHPYPHELSESESIFGVRVPLLLKASGVAELAAVVVAMPD